MFGYLHIYTTPCWEPMLLIISCIEAGYRSLTLCRLCEVAGVLDRIKDFLELLAVAMEELMHWLL